ncbi:hypothetical protein L7F22_008962 [Adiantum nelumboides]|nr:hypothetical protein [Adiantum nelumboides]
MGVGDLFTAYLLNEEKIWTVQRSAIEIGREEIWTAQRHRKSQHCSRVQLRNHGLQALSQLIGDVKSAWDSSKMQELQESCKRILYRWMCEYVSNGTLATMPMVTEDWSKLEDENTMYPGSMVEKGISMWECKICPWWLDYPLGVIPKQEVDLHAKFLEENKDKDKK